MMKYQIIEIDSDGIRSIHNSLERNEAETLAKAYWEISSPGKIYGYRPMYEEE